MRTTPEERHFGPSSLVGQPSEPSSFSIVPCSDVLCPWHVETLGSPEWFGLASWAQEVRDLECKVEGTGCKVAGRM